MMNLEGTVLNTIYESEETNFIVFRLQAKGRREPVTACGTFPVLTPGEEVFLIGEWKVHPRHGMRFEVSRYRSVLPATEAGIKRYLSSGLIKGIGKEFASRLVSAFGAETLNVIEQQPQRLREIEGVGPVRAGRILEAWSEQRTIREVMLFLHDCGLGTGYAAKIFRKFGQSAAQVIRDNPYTLTELRGIGFKTADGIARSIGIKEDSQERVQAGIVHLLWEATMDGHVFMHEEDLLREGAKFLELTRPHLAEGLRQVLATGKVTAMPGRPVNETDLGRRIYPASLLKAEAGIAREMNRLIESPRFLREFDAAKAAAWSEEQFKLELAEKQREAVLAALTNKVMVLTGGPGTGKTTITKCILSVYQALKVRMTLAAPTGRAARRLTETTRRMALTIHRLLKFQPGGGFQFNRTNQLKTDFVVIDESSMVDTSLMFSLLQAIPSEATVLIVGDINQLPSVGPGNVLRDLIESGQVPVVRLVEVFRQARKSWIISNAHRINEGKLPGQPEDEEKLRDFYLIFQDDPERVQETILEMAAERIPQRFGIKSSEVQILTPMNRGPLGTMALNEKLQARLNPDGKAMTRGLYRFRQGDRVMQLRNNYDKDVSNGDIGLVERVNDETQVLTVRFDEQQVEYDYPDLDELTLAYAATIHKSQGSEFPAVIIPLVTQHFMMLKRNLLYTGLTRARKLAVLVGSRKALGLAVNREDTTTRNTGLREFLLGREWEKVELPGVQEQTDMW